MRSVSVLACTCLFSALLTACGSSDSDSNPAPVTPDPDASTEAAVEDDAAPEAATEDAAPEADASDASTGPQVGSGCWVDPDCPADSRCWASSEGFPGGYCVIDACKADDCPTGSKLVEFSSGSTHCLDECATDDDCRKAEGYVCDQGVCYPGEGKVAPGASCGMDDSCFGGTNAYCLQQLGFIGGYCLVLECTDNCPEGSKCAEIFSNGDKACIPTCDAEHPCRPGYKCVDNAESSFNGSCVPYCETDDECPSALACIYDADFERKICKYVAPSCSQAYPNAGCDKGNVCDQGTCKPFACSADPKLEPNETQAAAQPLPDSDTMALQICTGDNDWYKLTPDKADTLYVVTLQSNKTSGDLDIDVTNSEGVVTGDARMSFEEYHSENAPGPGDLEPFTFVGSPGTAEVSLRVWPRYNGVNNYNLLVTQLPWKDGAKCEDLYTVDECRAQNCAHALDNSMLIPFPEPDPKDPFIGNGVFYKNGLTTGGKGYTPTTRRYARREVIMIIRNAIHAVQQAFPNTAPLGIGDVGLHDGSTPEGHPNGTHYYGANMDISYFIAEQYLGTFGNLPYRQICCDKASLTDWSCVDTSTSSSAYGTCKPGSETTHIVDIPRTAMFIAKVAGSGRLRVMGVEQKIHNLLKAEMDKQVTEGKITASEASAAKSRMASTNNDPSWLWHFNHLHASFLTGDASSGFSLRSNVQGPWEGDVPMRDQARMARDYYVRERARLTPAP